ncbi:general stress protein CsbD [Chitinimonas arctica]|uniref:General stress protein CsbD n=2 Tax=Chitinimonas arctica TaxID=2594795 RepID=A0A516SM15_9NEIS|nr:general stress protein CsbD [Chitinimonas arctica]
MAELTEANWQKQMRAAKITWHKLTDSELLRSEGQSQKLAGLVQERYAIPRAEADKQVASFFRNYWA